MPDYTPAPDPIADDETLLELHKDLQSRREWVWELMVQGIAEIKMAEIIGVSRKAIAADVAYWKRVMADQVSSLKTSKDRVAEEIGQTLKRLDWIFTNAVVQFETSSVAASKDKFLNTAMRAEVAKVRLLMETGFLPKAGVKVTVESSEPTAFGVIFGKSAEVLDDPVKRRKALEIAAKMITAAPLKKAEKSKVPSKGD